jgi:trehalose 6-phosphate synthase/phosphatase
LVDENGFRVDGLTLTDVQKSALKQQYWEKKRCIAVFLDEETARGQYDGYCKKILWPLFHYVLSEIPKSGVFTNDWKSYVKANGVYADAVVEMYAPGDCVWIHDYPLLLVPSYIREKIPSAIIGLFLHSPYPSSEIFRCLPERKEVLLGFLGANIIGFQTYSYARHFISSCTRVLGLESTPKGVDFKGNIVSIGIFPEGIDESKIEHKRQSPSVITKMKSIQEIFVGKKIIVGKDDLDQIKGVQFKLNAFEKFLHDYPDFRTKVNYVFMNYKGRYDSNNNARCIKTSSIKDRIKGF